MLNQISLIIGIVVGICSLSAMTISCFLWINRQLRLYLESKILQQKTFLTQKEKEMKLWIQETFNGYYEPLDDRLKDLNYRVKTIESKMKDK